MYIYHSSSSEVFDFVSSGNEGGVRYASFTRWMRFRRAISRMMSTRACKVMMLISSSVDALAILYHSLISVSR